MVPARPPLPTIRNFLFHEAGIHSSNFTSGAMTPATRQNAGTVAGAAPPRPPGTANGPAGTDAALVIVTPGSFSVVSRSQGCWAMTGSASTSSIEFLDKAIGRFYCFGLNICGEAFMKALVSIGATAALLAGHAFAQDACAGARDLKLTNGRIVTLDKQNTIVTEVTIQSGKFTGIGKTGDMRTSPCTKTVNLRGRTVVPGLIDNHNHIVLLGMRPGHDIRLETANSIADIQAMLKAKAKTVPAGEFITTLGDFNTKQFAEKRLPTLAELDEVLPNHPYLMNGGGT